jgi:hypothetical protein
MNPNASLYQAAAAAATTANNKPNWLTQIDAKSYSILNKQYSTASTQTYGLFYTSAKGLENKSDKIRAQNPNSSKFESKPALTAISAGQGYWRQQMDHICAHLKSFAHSNSEFKVLIAEPRLGRINSAKVDIDASWLTLTASFPIRSHVTSDSFHSSVKIDKAIKTHNYLNENAYNLMNAAVAGRDSSLSEDSVSEKSDSMSNEPQRRPVYSSKKRQSEQDKLTAEDRQLLKELSKTGKGNAKEVAYLIGEGANPNAVTREGLSMLHVAMKNRHFDCMPVLIEKKADLEKRLPPKSISNSILHEAVLLGPEADAVIKMLIGFGAKTTWKNSKNETPFDLAIKENNTAAINILGAQMGDNMIATYLKSNKSGIKP